MQLCIKTILKTIIISLFEMFPDHKCVIFKRYGGSVRNKIAKIVTPDTLHFSGFIFPLVKEWKNFLPSTPGISFEAAGLFTQNPGHNLD